MKITIDTERDSKEEIKKAISFLQGLVGDANTTSFQASSSAEPMMGFFDTPQAPSTNNYSTSSSSSGSMFDMFSNDDNDNIQLNDVEDKDSSDDYDDEDKTPNVTVIPY